jgi:hypothetical protein
LNYDFSLPIYHNAASLFSAVKFLKSYDEIKNYAASIGYELNADYRGYDDPNDHDNYQRFFALHVLLEEIASLSPENGDVISVYFDPMGDDVLACFEKDSHELSLDYHNIVC